MSWKGNLRKAGIESNGDDVELFRGHLGLVGRVITMGTETPTVLMVNAAGHVLLASGTTVPTNATAGYAKGCLFIKTNAGAGVKSLYENQGTTTSCAFDLLGAIAAGEITCADGKILVGNASNVTAAQTPSGDLGMDNAGVFTLIDRYRARTVASINTAGAGSPTAANLLGGMIKRDPNGGARTDTLPDAATLLAVMTNAGVGTFFECVYRNEATAHAQTITIASPGASVTLDPASIVIQPGNAKRLLFVFTNIGTGTEAVTVYDITRPQVLSGTVVAEDAKTTSREENIAGLSSAIALCTECRSDMISHFANATRHVTGQQSSAAFGAVPTTLAELLATTGTLLTAFAAHNADAILAGGWAYHNAQAADKVLTSDVTPVTLQEAVTRLNDLKTKYNDHEDEAVGHDGVGTVAADQVAAAAAAYGTAILVASANVLAGDTVSWAILNDGTGNVTGVSAVAGAGGITFTFSADPQNDAIISYSVFRALS